MNVTCDNCQKRYTVADEKVRGKTLKVRCRGCQNWIIIQRPTEYPEEERTAFMPSSEMERLKSQAVPTEEAAGPWEERTTAMPSPDPSLQWYAMVKGKQKGPLQYPALQAAVRSGEVSMKTYLWRPGMADWRRASEIPELLSLLAGLREDGPPPLPEPSSSASTVVAQPVATGGGRSRARTEPPFETLTDEGDSPERADPLGELFSDANAPPDDGPGADEPTRIELNPGKRSSAAQPDDPFAQMGDVDPSKLPPPGEATRFFIAQAGVNKRNPPWKIALAIGLFIGVPAVTLYALSELKVVRLEVTRIDANGERVKESVFSAAGVEGLRQLLTGANKKAEAAPPRRVAKAAVAAAQPTEAPDAGTGLATVTLPSSPFGGTVSIGEKSDFVPTARKEAVPEVDRSGEGLSEESVAKVVSQSQPAFQHCIEQELRKNPNFKGGKVNIVTTIGSSGIVKDAFIDRKDIDGSDLGGCLKQRAKRMQFASFAGDETEVHIPLILSAGF